MVLSANLLALTWRKTVVNQELGNLPQIARKVETDFSKMIEGSYGSMAPINRWLNFHNLSHSTRVAFDSATIMEVLGDTRGSYLAKIAGFAHDRWQLPHLSLRDLRRFSSRPHKSGLSERASCLELVTWSLANPDSEIASQDLALIEEAILATQMGIDENGVLRHIQLSDSSSILARVVAVVDTNRAALHGPLGWWDDTVRLQQEEDLWMLQAYTRSIGKKDDERARQNLIQHIERSRDFAIGQHDLLGPELFDHLTNSQKRKIKPLFHDIGKTRRFAEQQLRQARKQPMDRLLASFGYL